MKKRILILTSNDNLLPRKNTPILYLGAWCKIFSKKKKWEKYDYKIVPYHWNDRKKLNKDYESLSLLFDLIIISISKYLNKIHSIKRTNQFWEILIGPWLLLFIHVTFDRWYMLNFALKKFNVSDIRISDFRESVLANDHDDFMNLLFDDSDCLNNKIYKEILDFKKTKYSKRFVKYFSSMEKKKSRLNIKLILINVYNQLINFVPFIKNDICIMKGSIRVIDFLNLSLGLRNFPTLLYYKKLETYSEDKSLRKWEGFSIDRNLPYFEEDFISLLEELIPKFIPKSYLEGFQKQINDFSNTKWPKKPKIIFDSYSHISNDNFKFYLANMKYLYNTKFISLQHGGNYGLSKFLVFEDIIKSSSNIFISWGWRDDRYKNVIPGGFHKISKFKQIKKYQISKSKNILMPLLAIPRYSYYLYSFPISAEQYEIYLENQFEFISNLPSLIRRKLLIVPYPHDYNLCQRERWNSKFLDVRLAPKGKNVDSFLNSTRIYIVTYNATTLCESLFLNIPTLIFWRPDQFELRSEGIKQFDLFKKYNIFFDNPIDLSNHLSERWDDIESWWYSDEIQNVRNDFCKKYTS